MTCCYTHSYSPVTLKISVDIVITVLSALSHFKHLCDQRLEFVRIRDYKTPHQDMVSLYTWLIISLPFLFITWFTIKSYEDKNRMQYV